MIMCRERYDGLSNFYYQRVGIYLPRGSVCVCVRVCVSSVFTSATCPRVTANYNEFGGVNEDLGTKNSRKIYDADTYSQIIRRVNVLRTVRSALQPSRIFPGCFRAFPRCLSLRRTRTGNGGI